MDYLGIDVGGSAVKGALVNLEKGALSTPRQKIEMPIDARPEDVAGAINQIITQFKYQGAVGCGFPAPFKDGRIIFMANLDQSWVNIHTSQFFSQQCGLPFYVLNDADAAGMAEMLYGAGREYPKGVVLMLTLGTGIGSSIFIDGKLFPNTELGHLQIRGKDAEKRASAAVKTKKKLSWVEWTVRLQEYLDQVETILSPDVIIMGGGISKDAEKFIPALKLRAKILPALLRNEAGIVGAALYASQQNPC